MTGETSARPSNPSDEEVDRLLSGIYQIQEVQRLTGNSPRRGHEAALRAAVREWFKQNARPSDETAARIPVDHGPSGFATK